MVSPAETLDVVIARCDQGARTAHSHVRRFSLAHWVLSLSAAGLTASVGLTVFYDALPDASKAGLALAAVLANVAATGVRAEDRMAGWRVQRAAYEEVEIDARQLQQERKAAVTPAQVAELERRTARVRRTKAP